MVTWAERTHEADSGPVDCQCGAELILADGTRLVADIYAPAGDSMLPVLLMRQPYGRAIASTVAYAQPEYFARRGFLVVIQDVRGRGDSGGTFDALRQEAADGLETLHWAASLPRSNGRVCMYGFSYQAYAQFAVLAARPPELAAIAPHMAAADLYHGWFYPYGGKPQLSTLLGWGNQMLREDAWRAGALATAAALERSYSAAHQLCGSLPLSTVAPLTAPDAAPYVGEWLAHRDYDDYWQSLDHTDALAEAPTPVFHLAGYYDFYATGTCLAYRARKHRSEDWFVLGPWKHIPWERWICGLDLGDQARPDTDAALVNWLKAVVDEQAELRPHGADFFIIGANRWEHAAEWPPPSPKIRVLHLGSDGNANSLFGDGVLDVDPLQGGTLPDHFVYDPQVPVLAPGGNPPVWGPCDLSAQQQGNNLLVYDFPVDAEMTVAGHPELILQVATTAPQTDFVARLSFVEPGGTARFLTLAALPLSQAATLGGDRVHRFHFVFGPTAFRLVPGQRLRLDLASSAFPLLARDPNTGAHPYDVAAPTEFRIARQTVFHDPERPSRLLLPTVASCLPPPPTPVHRASASPMSSNASTPTSPFSTGSIWRPQRESSSASSAPAVAENPPY